MLIRTTDFVIEPDQYRFKVNILCQPSMNSFTVLKIFYHTNWLGRGNSVYYKRKNETIWKLMGERSPQKPQGFMPLTKPLEMDLDFELVSRCVFDTTSLKEPLTKGFVENIIISNTITSYFNYLLIQVHL